MGTVSRHPTNDGLRVLNENRRHTLIGLAPMPKPGNSDLLEEIKRKALEPDPSIKHRVELPGEVAAQLAQMCEDNRRVATALSMEKAKTERLTMLTKALYEAFDKINPGWRTSSFALSYPH